ncbi:outer membrane efflux protein [Leptospira fluminis]|uniref:Outer membrane efflux protein n=1 Tax=Leptospira fluminis TaxID=2484979 RepID=A0A4R9GQH6_9LEPT|nr:TolC family protein [Leptospira fluminis]TGK19940.1 outer membrane efflux protein [Leptospira fluminis]
MKVAFSVSISLIVFIGHSSLFAEESKLGFAALWEKVRTNSPAVKAKALEVRAAEVSKENSEYHWIPRVYTDLRNYNTNDPGLNFQGKLGQRAANEGDFSTASVRQRPSNYLDSNNLPYQNLNPNSLNLAAKDTLNHPGSNTYSRGTLGVDLALYEGGAKKNSTRLRQKNLEGNRFEEQYILKKEYYETAVAFQTIESSREVERKIEELIKKSDRFIRSYRIGASGNPLDKSGALALQSLRLKLESMKSDFSARRQASEEIIQMLSGTPFERDPSRKWEGGIRFAELHLPLPDRKAGGKTPLSEAYSAYAEGAEVAVDFERSRFLPKVGVYAEAYAYDGSRSAATSYNTGIYLQMNLLNPGDIGAVKEAKSKSAAAIKKAEEIRAREATNFRVLLLQEESLKNGLTLTSEALKNQEEQLEVNLGLFRSGTLQSVQIAEVFGRTVDVLREKYVLESEYLKVRAGLNMYNNLEKYNEL